MLVGAHAAEQLAHVGDVLEEARVLARVGRTRLGEVDVHTHNELASSFLGPAHAPFVFDPLKDKGRKSHRGGKVID